MNCSEALDWLHGTQMFGVRLGLENIRRLADALGIAKPTARIIHVAGTNGKGSVCAIAEAIAREAGHRTGLYTSPHLLRFNERIQINGEPVSDEVLAAGLTHIREIIQDWDPHPTFFEITTALALRIFEDAGVEVILLETGMGGRLDATNFVTPAVSVITRIDKDHARWLGGTLAAIAREKAGIIKPGVPVISLPQIPRVEKVLIERAKAVNAPISFITSPFDFFDLALAGSHQRWNATLAALSLMDAKVEHNITHLHDGYQNVRWPGRFQSHGPHLVLDGAHNPAAARRLVRTWREEYGNRRPRIVLGVLADKDLRGILTALVPLGGAFTAVTINNPRALSAAALADRLRAAGAVNVTTADLPTALAAVQSPTLVCGSLFLIGEALAWLEKAPLPRLSSQ